MARLRKGVAYRRLERPYTRWSKYKAKSYVRGRPHLIISKFDLGEISKPFSNRVELISREFLQIRQNSIEAARQTANRHLEKVAGKGNYHLKVKIYPHHILRENPLASGAGADRMSTGMSRAFGKVIGAAARVRKGQCIMFVRVNKAQLPVAKMAMKKASYKFAGEYLIVES